jgi:ribosome-associated protein
MKLKEEEILKETILKATTSGGKGGQNVNKVATRVELYFNIPNSNALTEEQKSLLLSKLNSKISEEGVLRIVSSEDRSQLKNRETVREKFIALLSQALKKDKVRRKTKPGKEVNEERIKEKKLNAEKKQRRSKLL